MLGKISTLTLFEDYSESILPQLFYSLLTARKEVAKAAYIGPEILKEAKENFLLFYTVVLYLIFTKKEHKYYMFKHVV